MINNRQTGRRRGRGGQQPRGIAGNNNSGNRQDNRQRGNAAQLLEKYKSMARDSQLAGDRVQTEYYLQFADHYFRVLGESRPRVDEQRRLRDDDSDADDEEGGEDRIDSDTDGDNDSDADGDEHQQDQPPRGRSDEPAQRSRSRPAADRSEQRRDRPNGRTRDDDDGRSRSAARDIPGDERIDFAVLPPAIGLDDGDSERPVEHDDDDAPRPRRRARRPRADDTGGDDVSAG